MCVNTEWVYQNNGMPQYVLIPIYGLKRELTVQKSDRKAGVLLY